MKALNLIKCHLSYLLSKSSIISILLVTIILFVTYITNSIASINSSLKEVINNYYISCLTTTKIIYCILFCFMMSMFYLDKNDAYISLIIVSRISKKEYYLTKLSSIAFLLFVNIIVLCLLFLFSGFVFIKGFVYDARFIKAFMCIYIISIIYALYANILVIITHNMFTFLIPSLLSILSSSLAQGKINTVKKIIFIFAPVSTNSLNKLYYDIYINIVIIGVLIFLNLLIYEVVDKRLE